MEDYKQKYNNLLKRYHNGCEYLKNHPEEFEKYLKLLLNISDQLSIIIDEHNITDSNIILNGFNK